VDWLWTVLGVVILLGPVALLASGVLDDGPVARWPGPSARDYGIDDRLREIDPTQEFIDDLDRKLAELERPIKEES